MFTNMTTNLMVESVEESLAFYRDKLGFSEVASVPNDKGGLQFAILGKDKFTLMVQERENFIEEYPILDVPKVRPSVSLYISVDDFEQHYARVKAQCEILCEVHTTFYGGKEFAISDNNGYVITFAEHKEE